MSYVLIRPNNSQLARCHSGGDVINYIIWVKIKHRCEFQDHVLHVVHLGHFIHVLQVGHLHIIPHAQCYCFLYFLYNSGLMQLDRRKEKGYIIWCIFNLYQAGLHTAPLLSTTNILSIKRRCMCSGKRSSH